MKWGNIDLPTGCRVLLIVVETSVDGDVKFQGVVDLAALDWNNPLAYNNNGWWQVANASEIGRAHV